MRGDDSEDTSAPEERALPELGVRGQVCGCPCTVLPVALAWDLCMLIDAISSIDETVKND